MTKHIACINTHVGLQYLVKHYSDIKLEDAGIIYSYDFLIQGSADDQLKQIDLEYFMQNGPLGFQPTLDNDSENILP